MEERELGGTGTFHTAGARWGVSGGACTLNSNQHGDHTTDAFLRTDGSGHSINGNPQIFSTRTCEDRPCAEEEVCVPVTAGTAHICLLAPPRDIPTSTSTPTSTSIPPVNDSTTSETDTPVATASTTVEHTDVDITTDTTVLSADTTSLTTTATTTSAAKTTTTTAPAATTTALAEYVGCYRDRRPRFLPDGRMQNALLTTETCLLYCQGKGFIYFGTQNRNECYCGNSIKSGYERLSDDECSFKCAGDPETTCGGSWKNSVYKIVVYS
ncbi:WSC domain-containing protein ARB_07870-like [Haliotis rufescens]|uniref:WSC domain-containing protein ARB_07870-like n=1 Tax=Haliotis rufescens TaxID=6454 RepID=UPI00201E7973|nr:WSC domain-containing protein ARB_07870-like [Haliotis rufescens]